MASVVHGQTATFAGITSTFGFNPRLQPTSIYATSPNGAILDFAYNFSYGTANNGNVASITNNRAPGRSQSFTYDELNRIKSAVSQAASGADCWGQLFGHMNGGSYVSGYDPWANLKEITPEPSRPGCAVPTLGLTINGQNRIADPGFSYDLAGNLTAIPNPGGLSITYDAENRITSTSAGVSYTYDGDGKRVRKSNGTLYWFGAGLDALAETDAAGNNPREFIFFGGKRIARRDSSGTVTYFFSNHLGSVNVVADALGEIVEESDFYPFGGERILVDGHDNPYKFTGKERDVENGLDFFGARSYSSSFGRFLQADLPFADQEASDPQSWNLYAYVGNSPLVFSDPTGRGKVRLALKAGKAAAKESLNYLRKKAVREAWQQEKELLEKTGRKTANFSRAEQQELLEKSKVSGWQGHHINSVKGHPEMAGNPDNVKFVKGSAENLKEHGGNFQNETSGELIERSKLMGGLTAVVSFFDEVDAKSEMVAEAVPIASSSDSWLSWINPVNDLIEAGALVHSLFNAVAGEKPEEKQKQKKKGK